MPASQLQSVHVTTMVLNTHQEQWLRSTAKIGKLFNCNSIYLSIFKTRYGLAGDCRIGKAYFNNDL